MSLGAILISSTAFFAELQASLNTIWRIQPRQDGAVRRVLLRRIRAFATVVGISFCLMLSVLGRFVVSAAGEQLRRWIPASQNMLSVGDSLLTFALATISFALIFRVVPEERLSWPSVAAVTAVMFIAGMQAISYYIAKAGVGSAYGAAGSLLAVLVWIYYSAQLLNRCAPHSRVRRVEPCRNYSRGAPSLVGPKPGAGRPPQEAKLMQDLFT